MRFPSREVVEELRKKYPVGTRVDGGYPGTAYWYKRNSKGC